MKCAVCINHLRLYNRYLIGKLQHNDDRNIKRIFTDIHREPLSNMKHIPQKWNV